MPKRKNLPLTSPSPAAQRSAAAPSRQKIFSALLLVDEAANDSSAICSAMLHKIAVNGRERPLPSSQDYQVDEAVARQLLNLFRGLAPARNQLQLALAELQPQLAETLVSVDESYTAQECPELDMQVVRAEFSITVCCHDTNLVKLIGRALELWLDRLFQAEDEFFERQRQQIFRESRWTSDVDPSALLLSSWKLCRLCWPALDPEDIARDPALVRAIDRGLIKTSDELLSLAKPTKSPTKFERL